MWVSSTVALMILTAYITSRVCAQHARRVRDEEEKRRKERRRELSALEAKCLSEGLDDSGSGEFPEVALLRSMGNVAYLIWLLNYEPKFRSYRGDGKNPYPPDWEWRRRFVFLRDHGICQGCKKDSSQGITLDCHHIKPISEFGADEVGIHSLINLISLCPLCHAGQHLDNRMLAERAARTSSRNQPWLPSSRKLVAPESDPNIAIRLLKPTAVVEVQPSPDLISQHLKEPHLVFDHPPAETAQRPSEVMTDSKAKTITEGLEWIDKRVSEMKFQNVVRRCTDEDIYCNCDYCDTEILANPFQMSAKGKFLCDEYYRTTGGKE
jgi:5-methylcytosine-specific restriction endonuclease McrA